MNSPKLMKLFRQNGYGAHKRKEHCEVCYTTRAKVGEWRAEYADGSVRFFCDDHTATAFVAPEPVPSDPSSTH